MSEDYSKFLIKQYDHWKLQVFENQGYLGRCVVWCDREDALDLTDATPEEYQELLHICKEWRNATINCFGADWHNYAFLGNETAHLHGHLVPRYKQPVVFNRITYTDELWGQRYQTDKNYVTSSEASEDIRDMIKSAL